jgi:hypothetical protein
MAASPANAEAPYPSGSPSPCGEEIRVETPHQVLLPCGGGGPRSGGGAHGGAESPQGLNQLYRGGVGPVEPFGMPSPLGAVALEPEGAPVGGGEPSGV